MADHARNTDPDTSHDAADSVAITEQCMRVLLAMARLKEATSSELDESLGFRTPTYWRRCSDLLNRYHLFALTGERRPGRHGGDKSQRVYTLSARGVEYARNLKGK